MRYLGIGLILALASCTVDNPLYTPGVSGDLAGTTDLAGTKLGDLSFPADKSDLADPACMIGQRACLASGSAGCHMGTFVKDRTCPTGSACTTGYCQAPPPATNNVGKDCAPTATPTESLCVAGLSGGEPSKIPSCQPFLDPNGGDIGKGVHWVCAPPIGTGISGTPCTEGSQCRSGFCGSNGTCFRSCITAADCPAGNPGGGWTCSVVSITVEGSMLMASSCVM
jgi:hypothetical protein